MLIIAIQCWKSYQLVVIVGLMQLKCSRYVFSYNSTVEVVKDFILRSVNLAELTFGRDKHFARLNQVLEQARFLGWPIPRYGSAIPEEFTDIPPAGIDHIFENQAKLLVDVAPVARVQLASGEYCSVKMICSSTAAGDLIWKCHLLTKDGSPYIIKRGKPLKVATKGTKIVCQPETLVYSHKELFDAFGGEKEGVWPMPFLPEFCIDRPIAGIFAPEAGVVESVKIHETNPITVLATEMVPWYRVLTADTTRALTVDDERQEHRNIIEHKKDKKLSKLVAGWEDLEEESPYEEMEQPDLPAADQEDDTPIQYTNIQIELSSVEQQLLSKCDREISSLGISNRTEAEQLRADPKHKQRAERWLLAAVQRARLLANSSQKIGCVVTLVQRHRDRPIIIVQPHQKWAQKLAQVLSAKGFKATAYTGDKLELRSFYEGDSLVLITSEVKEQMLLEETVIICATSFGALDWIAELPGDCLVYGLSIKQLGYEDQNLITEHPQLEIVDEYYTGPSIDILKLEIEPEPAPMPVEAAAEPQQDATPAASSAEGQAPESVGDGVKPKKKAKFRIKTEKGRPKMVPSYEKALEIAKKLETEGKKVEIYPPDSEEATYISGLGELDK